MIRGVINHREFKTQVADMSGLTFGKITPTDLDAFMDFNNKLFVFVEAKHGTSKMPYGQQLAIERLCDACHQPPIRYAKYRWGGKWLTPQSMGATLVQGVNRFRQLCLSSNVVNFQRAGA